MFTLKIQDLQGGFMEFNGIKKITYSNSIDTVSLEGDEIFNHEYPTCYNLHLYSDKSSYTVDKKNISIIEVIKE